MGRCCQPSSRQPSRRCCQPSRRQPSARDRQPSTDPAINLGYFSHQYRISLQALSNWRCSKYPTFCWSCLLTKSKSMTPALMLSKFLSFYYYIVSYKINRELIKVFVELQLRDTY